MENLLADVPATWAKLARDHQCGRSRMLPRDIRIELGELNVEDGG
jgi:hypothetical protein